MLGERLEPRLPRLAALQRDGAVSVEKVTIVERAMHTLTRPGVEPEAVQTAEQLLAEHAPILGPSDLRRFARVVVDAADPDGPEPVDDALQHDRRYLELTQRRDGMWHLAGRLTTTLGAQLNAIVEPLAKPRTSSIDNHDGTTTRLPDERPSVQRLHHALDEACAKLLKSADLPSVGGVPASVVITITLDNLLGTTGVAETADGTPLSADQLRRIADEADIWPLITTSHATTSSTGSPADKPASTTSPCCVGITTALSEAGPAASTTTAYPNGYRPDGPTPTNNPTSTPASNASNASTPNDNSSPATGDE